MSFTIVEEDLEELERLPLILSENRDIYQETTYLVNQATNFDLVCRRIWESFVSYLRRLPRLKKITLAIFLLPLLLAIGLMVLFNMKWRSSNVRASPNLECNTTSEEELRSESCPRMDSPF